MKKMLRNVMVASVTLFAFAVNPAYLIGCGVEAGPEEFQFDEADMLGVLEAVDTYSFEADGGEVTVTLALEQSGDGEAITMAPLDAAGFFTAAMACGSRSFIKDAAACITTTEMPVEGTITVEFAEEGAASPEVLIDSARVKGGYIVMEYELDNGDISLRFEDDPNKNLFLLSRDGQTFDLQNFRAMNLGGRDIDYVTD